MSRAPPSPREGRYNTRQSPAPSNSTSRGPNNAPRKSSSTATGSGSATTRVPTQSAISVSYAYGAPSVGMPASRRSLGGGGGGGGDQHGPARDAQGPNLSSSSGSDNEPDSHHDHKSTLAPSISFTGRAAEPASVRYARLAANRTQATGTREPGAASAAASAYQHQNTSVNIATAFQRAVRDQDESAAAPVGAGKYRQHDAAEEQSQEVEEGDSGSGKETHVAGGPAGTPGSKKRKKRSPVKDPTFKHREGETTGSEDDGLDGTNRGKRAKKNEAATVATADDVQTTSPRTKASRRKAGDATYRPTNQTDSGSEEYSSDDGDRTRRRRSKGKGRASSSGPQAIPIGRRDSEVWYGTNGKKRRSRKAPGSRSISVEAGATSSSSPAAASRNQAPVEDDDQGMLDQEDVISDAQRDIEGDDTVEIPAAGSTSFFLRLREASPSADAQPPSPRSPFRALSASVDPSFAEFDQSLQADERSRRDASMDASDVRGSSYDYSEEERIMTMMEEQKSRRGLRTAAPISAATASIEPGVRRRLPGPPGRKQPILDGIREEPPLSPPHTERAPKDTSSHPSFGLDGESGLGEFLGRLTKSLFGSLLKWTQNPLLDWKKVWQAGIGAVLLCALVWSLLGASPRPNPQVPSTPARRSWLHPFSPAHPSFTAPTTPPDSLLELAKRLSVLEGAFGELSSISQSERIQATRSHHQLRELDDKVATIETELDGERKSVAKALAANDAAHGKEAKELQRILGAVRGELDTVVSRVRVLSDDRQADAGAMRALHSSVESVGKDVAALGSRVAQVAKDVQNGIDAERISAIALEAIEARLPSKLAVRMDDSGKPVFDPAFWKHLRNAFADKRDVERMVASQVARMPQGKDSTDSGPHVVVREPSWDDFIVANEASLRGWIANDITSRAGSDAIVTKRTFLDMLRREIKLLKADFEAKANENVEKIGQEILNKVAKQEDMRKKDSLASHLNPFHRSPPTTDGSHVTIKTSDGQNVSAIVTSLVDAALLRYSKDVLAQPDYALFTAGARVVRSLTSPTYEPHPIGAGRRALAWLTGNQAPRGRPPVTALHPDNSPGACWPFAGQQGQLGIHLSRRVVMSDITLEHVSVDVALDGEVSSAPREFEVWGVVTAAEDVQRLAEYRRTEHEARRTAAADDGLDALDDNLLPASIPPTPNHLLLANGVYDPANSSPIQTFPVTPAARSLAIPVDVVVLRILSNHGEKAYTCLYRVRVSGKTEASIKSDAD